MREARVVELTAAKEQSSVVHAGAPTREYPEFTVIQQWSRHSRLLVKYGQTFSQSTVFEQK